ncbi:MAG: hypothetical protein DMG91_09775, partial [Acidobacteria bacterium]
MQIRRIITLYGACAVGWFVYFLLNLSVRESFSRANDADLMVGVFEVHVLHQVLRHMAGHTITHRLGT